MNKINEALESGRNGEQGLEQPLVLPLPENGSTPPPPKPSELGMEDEMLGLYQTIDSLLADAEKKVIQFIGSKEGEGTTTIVKEFARVVAEKFGKSVLLLDTGVDKTSQLLFFGLHADNSLDDSFENGEPIDKALCQVGGTSLFVVKSSSKPFSSAVPISDPLNQDDLWENLRERFDLILVDSVPATVSSNGFAFARKVDGVVLVLEAEKTRFKVIESVKDKIIKNGGKILGVVLNKRKHYIPKFIYKFL